MQGVLAKPADGSMRTLQKASESAAEQATYEWAAQWYPMAFTQDLDPKKPHAGAPSSDNSYSGSDIASIDTVCTLGRVVSSA